ncbi:MAG: hypothetical protein RLZZ330_558 [Actinomycetota bacterium]|jgi:dye decolorizing peroxidase
MSDKNIDRRRVISIGATAAVGLTVGASSAEAVHQLTDNEGIGVVGKTTIPFFGKHQAGIETPIQAKVTFVAFDLTTTNKSAVARLLRLWTSDISLMMAGKPAMADTNSEIAATPARLTVTFGLGYSLFNKLGIDNQWPLSVTAIPSYKIDQLDPAFCDGDLLLQICADDALTVSHAVRELVKDAKPFADVKWTQQGFASHHGINPGETPRNLMGQVDGTDNPKPETEDFNNTVWNKDGSTTFVLRRIQMNLETWDLLSRPNQEKVIGRNRKNGAPLTGVIETDTPDYELEKNGELVIPMDAHIRRATGPRNLMRRVFNYDESPTDQGLLFATYQADINQYLEIQARLASKDSLNAWTTPVGSAMFYIPPGTQAGDWLASPIFG